THTRLSGSGYCTACSSTVSRIANIAEFAPIPSASSATTETATSGVRRITRRPNRRSCSSVSMEWRNERVKVLGRSLCLRIQTLCNRRGLWNLPPRERPAPKRPADELRQIHENIAERRELPRVRQVPDAIRDRRSRHHNPQPQAKAEQRRIAL